MLTVQMPSGWSEDAPDGDEVSTRQYRAACVVVLTHGTEYHAVGSSNSGTRSAVDAGIEYSTFNLLIKP